MLAEVGRGERGWRRGRVCAGHGRGGRGELGGDELSTLGILKAGYKIGFREVGDGFVDTAATAEAGEGDYEGCGHYFVIFAALFYLRRVVSGAITDMWHLDHTAVRTRQSSAVRYRNAFVSSFILI